MPAASADKRRLQKESHARSSGSLADLEGRASHDWMEQLGSSRSNHNFLSSSYSYTNLFNLESLVNFQLPNAGDDLTSCTSSSVDGNVGSKGGQRRLNESMNGIKAKRPVDVQSEMTLKRKRVQVEAEAGSNALKRDDADSNDEIEMNYGINFSEEHYRDMLGEHLKKYRRAQLKEAIAARFHVTAKKKPDTGLSARDGSGPNRKLHKLDFGKQELHGAFHMEGKVFSKNALDLCMSQPPDNGLQPARDFGTTDSQRLGVFDLLDIGDGIVLELPPLYDQLAPLLGLPDFAAMEMDERLLNGQLKPGALFAMVASDPLAKRWKARFCRGGNEQSHQSSALHGTTNGHKRFSLQVFEPMPLQGGTGLDGFVETPDSLFLPSQEGSLVTWRQILSDSGILRQCEVKVLERGDGYEVIERRVAKKDLIKRDPAVIVKEDNDKIGKYWVNLLRKDLPKHHKNFVAYYRKQSQDAKKFAECCQREVKYRGLRSLKVMKAAPMRIRKLARDMVIFWKKVDREQAELRKKEEKEAAEALKREEELREARRQQQRLNFLLTQTELYSHFMQNKMTGLPAQPALGSELTGCGAALQPENLAGEVNLNLADDDAEEAAWQEEALRAAQNAVSQQRMKTDAFDDECFKLRQAGVQNDDAAADIDLLHPSTMPATSSVQQPTIFNGILKEYQLKGLQWLVNCYEQGLNGILADEMGLGKTIQAMAFLAHLAEEKNIWGPFLVVAPASVLNNWADEVHRFCPDFKILPYWGGLQERTVLRKNISPKRLYRRDAVFHILITSYQLLVSDEKYLRRVKWQYMVLDEAQAIKSASSIRWKTLLSFNCRNRLLLTGTPIQNNMAELWALLHFIMPTLFDSHEQFNEWFSKGIESHAEHGGTLNEHQLNRLHSILKPFMLRRVKKDVITEMTNKKEVVIPCSLSSRQQAFYQAIKNKISVADLFDSSGGHLNEKKVLNLMNIVIQLRKVCNHPELFERNEGRTFAHFSVIQPALLPPPFGEPEWIHYSGAQNPISYKVPKLLYRDGMRCLPTSSSGSAQGFKERWISNNFNIFSPANVNMSIFSLTADQLEPQAICGDGFGFTRLIDLSPSEVGYIARASVLERLLLSASKQDDFDELLEEQVDQIDEARFRAVSRLLLLPMRSELAVLKKRLATGLADAPFEALVISHQKRFLANTGLLRSVNTFIPAVRAPQIDVLCSDRGFSYQREEDLENPWIKRLLLGFARTSDRNGPAMPDFSHHYILEQDLKIHSQHPLLALPHHIFGSCPPLQSFDFAKMLTDSGKLQTLDALLKRLRAENHRVLLFAQMTKMLNILEDYMNYRKYKYLRLDGSSTIMDRRDMVKDFQHRGDIFVFLLSTRAGGLGINLTAADTVIFYESDWNPTMDLQAMDRAHRLGQTKEVTVYRLICKGTVEEKIVKRASQKNTVQQLVMTGGHSQGDVFEAEEVVSLLLDDTELEEKMKEQVSKQSEKLEKRKKGWGVVTAGVKTAVRLDAEGGASIEEENPLGAIGDGASDPNDGGAEKGAENGAIVAKQRQAKRRNDAEGKPPKPPKAPKLSKGSNPKKDVKESKCPLETKDPGIPKVKGRSRKSASVTAMTSGKLESLHVLMNGSETAIGEASTPSKKVKHDVFEMYRPVDEEQFSPHESFSDVSFFPAQNEGYIGQPPFFEERIGSFPVLPKFHSDMSGKET